MPIKVCILMSTYNGERYLQRQLESVENARNTEEIIYFIRDDGSSDRTHAILSKWADTHTVAIEKGLNIGVKESFLWLFSHAPDADFYALCDQDDEWTMDKLQRAEKRLTICGGTPAVYYSAQEEIDENSRSLGVIRAAHNPNMTFENSFIYNYAPGCAQVFNSALMQKIKQYAIEHCVMHDMIPIQLAGLFGEILYDDKPTIRYRQHSSNVTTAKRYSIKKFYQHWHVWAHASGCPLAVQAQEYLNKVGNGLPEEAKSFLMKASSYKKNIYAWYFLWNGNVQAYGGWKRNRSFRVRVFLKLA